MKFNYALLLGVLLSLFYSCSSDRAAVQRVLTKKPLFDTVGEVYMQLHPCEPITETHTVDTSYYYDTSVIRTNGLVSIIRTNDTIEKYIHDTITITHTNTRYIHERDTIVDGQQIAILKSQIQDKEKQISALSQSATDNRLLIIQEHSRGNHWQLLFWILIAAIAAVVVLVILKPRL
jgi:hypothetical protein